MYDHKSIEQKWQKLWAERRLYEVVEEDEIPRKNRRYVLDMFPYPSAAGLHVGHPEGYTATDIYSRYLRMRGYHVLHPMGWDSFGLPAENYAIKEGVHPRESTWKNIETFRRQIQDIGFSYDWSREINTASPEYYRWTQWFFLFFYKRNLAYRKKAPVNWCVSCQTVLAREQVVQGRCERCKSEVIQKELEQWFFKITEYADRLLQGLDTIDWPESIKLMQRNWIGKSEGVNITYTIDGTDKTVTVFTTRPDTNFGATFITVAPDSSFVKECFTLFPEQANVAKYVESALRKTELERMAEGRVKTGVFTGWYAINQLNGKRMPVYISDFVFSTVGTGAVVGVPGHDLRDFEFAQTLNLEIIRVVVGEDGDISSITRAEQVQEEKGVMINSGFLDGLEINRAKDQITKYIEENGWGKRVTNYKLRDWLISRQRYWGAPIPIIYCDSCGEAPVPEESLPVLLPDDVDFLPTGESPLVRSKSFHKVLCPKCGRASRRESDTLDTFVCSSWYLYRYTDPKNTSEFASKKKMAYWLPVDLYVGGAEHAVMHLLYARFFCKALYDAKYITFDEPFTKLINQGLIIGEDGQKMSKSRGNVINPDDVVSEYGADCLRMYEMFMGPFEDAKPWSTQGINGIRRFLEKVYILFPKSNHESFHGQISKFQRLEQLLHKTIKKVTEDIESFKFNTAISQMMIFINEFQKQKDDLDTVHYKLFTTNFLLLLAPFAPHIAEELWSRTGHTASIFKTNWPLYKEEFIKDETITVVVQINGKARGEVNIARDADQSFVLSEARSNERVAKFLAGKEVKREVYVKGKIVNFVVA